MMALPTICICTLFSESDLPYSLSLLSERERERETWRHWSSSSWCHRQACACCCCSCHHFSYFPLVSICLLPQSCIISFRRIWYSASFLLRCSNIFSHLDQFIVGLVCQWKDCNKLHAQIVERFIKLTPINHILFVGCAATRPDPTQGPSEGNNRTCTELSKRSPLLYCEHHACVVNCRIEGFAEGGFCNWLRCLCKRPCWMWRCCFRMLPVMQLVNK